MDGSTPSSYRGPGWGGARSPWLLPGADGGWVPHGAPVPRGGSGRGGAGRGYVRRRLTGPGRAAARWEQPAAGPARGPPRCVRWPRRRPRVPLSGIRPRLADGCPRFRRAEPWGRGCGRCSAGAGRSRDRCRYRDSLWPPRSRRSRGGRCRSSSRFSCRSSPFAPPPGSSSSRCRPGTDAAHRGTPPLHRGVRASRVPPDGSRRALCLLCLYPVGISERPVRVPVRSVPFSEVSALPTGSPCILTGVRHRLTESLSRPVRVPSVRSLCAPCAPR